MLTVPFTSGSREDRVNDVHPEGGAGVEPQQDQGRVLWGSQA